MTENEPSEFVPEESNERARRAAPRARASRRQQLRATRLEVGSVIGNTFSIWFGNFLPFSAMALLIYSPILVIAYVFFAGSPSLEEILRFAWIRGLVDWIFFASLLTGTVTYGVIMQLRGDRAGMGRCLTIGLSRLFHVFAVTFLIIMMCFVCFIPFLLTLLAGLGGLSLLLGIAGFIPLIMILITYHVAVPTVIVERAGVGQALARSSMLTKGSRLTIFGILLIFLVMLMVVNWVFQRFVLGAMMAGTSLPTIVLVQSIFGVLLSTVWATIPSVIYHDLRVGKEGVDVKDLAAVFD